MNNRVTPPRATSRLSDGRHRSCEEQEPGHHHCRCCSLHEFWAGSRRGWRKSGKRFRSSQIGTPSRTDIGDVSPCLSDLGSPTALNERCRTVKERRLKLFALKQEVVRTGQLWRHERRPPPSSRKSCLRARKPCASSTAFIMAIIEGTQVKPPATLLAQTTMPDAYRNMRSWRARCLRCRCNCRRATRTRRGWRRAPSHWTCWYRRRQQAQPAEEQRALYV